ncbi:hypothetical protein HDC32_005346 [Pseudomonas sp. JAI120]|nr:hypothetical protein [Pseudomonas sp. SJZ073]MBB6315626.1 hypothetical protein [Pseudomonas sp. JAI120]
MTGVGAQIVELFGILQRDDEPELVPVAGAAFLERFEVGIVSRRPVGMARAALAINAFALDVAQVRGGRARPGLRQIDQLCVARDAPDVGPKSSAREARGNLAAAQAGRWPTLSAALPSFAPALLV